MTYIIAEPCVDLLDKACIEECPVDCIYEGNRMLYIHPDECVDCGACEPVCPVEAIFYEDDVPEQWKDYTDANYEFFEDLGSPGGASKVGKIDKDHAVRGRAAAARGRALTGVPVSADACRTSPGTCWSRPRRSRRRTRTASSTCPSARRSTRCPPVSSAALAAASDAPGYPLTAGTPGAAGGDRAVGGPRLRRAPPAASACCRRSAPRSWSAWLPTLLGLGPGDVVVIPPVCYPTYEVGARLAGATVVRADSLTALGPATRVRLIWVNSPANPTGRVLPAGAPAQGGRLGPRARRGRGQRRVLPDAGLGGRRRSSVLSPSVSGGDYDRRARRALAVQAVQPGRLPGRLRGRRPGAGRRAAGGPQARRHDRARRRCRPRWWPRSTTRRTSTEQRARYAARRARAARRRWTAAGFAIDHSEAGPLPVGDPRRGLLGHRGLAGRAGHPGRARRRSTARPATAHVRVAPDRHRRAHRRRRCPARRTPERLALGAWRTRCRGTRRGDP